MIDDIRGSQNKVSSIDYNVHDFLFLCQCTDFCSRARDVNIVYSHYEQAVFVVVVVALLLCHRTFGRLYAVRTRAIYFHSSHFKTDPLSR